MAYITLRVLDGADRGKVYEKIEVPVTIGREEGNTIQLNDERISRFHLKIQKDHDDIVLTDLESTNGSKVNNEEVQLRILRHGDLITVGRSTLIFGDRDQINRRLRMLDHKNGAGNLAKASGRDEKRESNSGSESAELAVRNDWREDPHYQLALLDIDPPSLPDRLSPGQAAKLAETLDYVHMYLRRIIMDAEVDQRQQRVEFSLERWQQLLDLQSRLSEYLKKIYSPGN